MKNLNIYLLMLLAAMSTFFVSAQETSDMVIQKPDSPLTGKFDYWQQKQEDTAFNFYRFKQEFREYWNGKTPAKGSGYKPIARWLENQKAYVNADGTLRSPQQDYEQAMAFANMSQTQGFSGQWTSIGPDQPVYRADQPDVVIAQGGRVSAIAFDPVNPDKIFVGAPVGGLWVSNNNGLSWQNLNTDNISALGVSAIAIDPTNTNRIYIGTGDRDGHDTRGIGIFKSEDGGQTWTGFPLDESDNHYVSKIIIRPGHPGDLLVSSNRGTYRSLDYGEEWSKTSDHDIRDMALLPGSMDTVYCVSGSVLYKSANFGQMWVQKKWIGSHRIALDVSRSKIRLFCSKDSHFYKLMESEGFNDPTEEILVAGLGDDGQCGYNLDIVSHPENPDILYAGMINLYQSTDGGSHWNEVSSVYADDQHIFEYSPHTHRLFIGNDSGIWITDNLTDYTYSSNGLRISSGYRMDVAAGNPNHIIVGNQDASTFVTNGGPWYSSIGGDGITCKFDHTNENYVYGSSQHGAVSRSVNGGTVNAGFTLVAGADFPGVGQVSMFQTPFMIGYSNPNHMFYGAHDLFMCYNIKATDIGEIFYRKKSEDLTSTNQDEKIEFIEQSRADSNIVYIAYENGRMFRCDNILNQTGNSWTELPNPEGNYWAGIRFESHSTLADVVYMVKGQKVYKSANRGGTWQDITGTLPKLGMMSVAYMHGSDDGLYIGTTAGVYYKENSMPEWQLFKSGLPLTQVRDLVINYSTTPPQIFASTFGRGIWKTSVLNSYKHDLVALSGTATVNATTVSAITGFEHKNNMMVLDTLKTGFYLSTNQIFSSGDILIHENTHTNLGPGLIFQTLLPSVDLALIDPAIAPGTYYLGMICDNDYAVDETNETNNTWGAAQQVTIPANPGTVENVQATDGDYDDRVTISWQNNTGEPLYYAVYRATIGISSLASRISPDTWLTQPWFNDVTAPNGVTYYYFVKTSRYPDGWRASDFSGYDAGFRRLSPPADVMATDGLYSDKVSISWDASPGATHYQVFRSNSGDPLFALNISGPLWISSTTFDDTDVIQGTAYTYFIKAAKSQMGSNQSDMSAGDAGWKAFATAPTATASDGIYTNRIAVTWNTVSSATHYMVYRSTSSVPNSASPITSWQTANNYTDYSANTGIIYYYWIKASQNAAGTVTTGLGLMDQGYRNFVAPTGVTATDGTSTTGTTITWNSVSGATWYRVNRGTSSNSTASRPVGNWTSALSLTDETGTPGTLYYYWVSCSNDTIFMGSALSASNTGFRQITAPVTNATDGYYANQVEITWQSVPGATYYQVQRSPVSDPGNLTVLAPWSNTLGFSFTDLTAVYGQEYLYFVSGAGNVSGLRPGNPGSDEGMAASCGNLTDMPAFRNLYLHGTTLDITHQVINEGPYAMLNSSTLEYALESDPADGIPEAIIGSTIIPPLNPGETYTVFYQVDLDTVTGFSLTYGNWHLAFYTTSGNGNCDHNAADNYIVWQEPGFTYTDALHGIYTVGPGTCDFSDPAAALNALKTRGISDNTIFYLEPVVFNQQLEFSGIQGTDLSRKIIFTTNPAYSDTAEIRGTPTPEANYTLSFRQCNNLSFTNLKISSAGSSDFESTYGRIISIGPDCSELRFRYNHFEGYTDVSHGGTDNVPIYCQNPTVNLLIDNNLISNGWYGIYFSGRQASPISGFTISNNTIQNFYTDGIFLHETADFNVTGNKISASNNTAVGLTGIGFSNSRGGFDCSRNHIMLSSSTGSIYGLVSSDVELVNDQPRRITNNFISCSTESVTNAGINLGTNMNITVAHNSVHVYGNSGILSYCIQIHSFVSASDFNSRLFNNILVNTAGGSGINYYHNNLNFNLLNQCDYNDIYTSSGPLISYGPDNFSSLSAWSAATGFDLHSLSVSPEFLTETDLHCNSPLLDGAGIFLSDVAWDKDDEPRSTVNPDIGADEFTYAALPKTLELDVFLEGLYNGPNTMRQANDENGPHFGAGIGDQITVELRSASDYYNVVHIADHVNLSTSGLAMFAVPASLTGSYYITIRHRNSIATVSATPVHFITGTVSHSFSSPASAYGSNLLQMITGQYVIFGGDVNQDGVVDTGDMTPVDNDAANFTSGYLATDVNGDGTIDTGDVTIIDNNAAAFVGSITP